MCTLVFTCTWPEGFILEVCIAGRNLHSFIEIQANKSEKTLRKLLNLYWGIQFC